MPTYSKSSMQKLETAHLDLQKVFLEVIKGFDNTILYGHRSPDEQFELYKRGRVFSSRSGAWTISREELVVTYKDGYSKKSTHNITPSLAIDATPYPIDWDKRRAYFFGGYVLAISEQLGISIRWGGDWDGDTIVDDQNFIDLYHFELVQERRDNGKDI